VDGYGLDRALDGATPPDLECANAGQHQPSVGQLPAGLAVREAVVAVSRAKARITRLLSGVHTAEERGKGPLDPLDHVLQDLRADLAVLGPHLLNAGQLALLRVVADGNASRTVGVTALLQGSVVQLAAAVQHPLQARGLGVGWIQAIAVRFADVHTSLLPSVTSLRLPCNFPGGCELKLLKRVNADRCAIAGLMHLGFTAYRPNLAYSQEGLSRGIAGMTPVVPE
jgi:hypothetical protein